MSLEFEVIDPFDPADLRVPQHVILAAGRGGERKAAPATYTGMGEELGEVITVFDQ